MNNPIVVALELLVIAIPTVVLVGVLWQAAFGKRGYNIDGATADYRRRRLEEEVLVDGQAA